MPIKVGNLSTPRKVEEELNGSQIVATSTFDHESKILKGKAEKLVNISRIDIHGSKNKEHHYFAVNSLKRMKKRLKSFEV